MLGWFIRFPEFAEFTEFPFNLGKTPIIDVECLSIYKLYKMQMDN